MDQHQVAVDYWWHHPGELRKVIAANTPKEEPQADSTNILGVTDIEPDQRDEFAENARLSQWIEKLEK